MWFHLTDKATGARQIVATLDGCETDQFDVVEIGREPGEFEVFAKDTLVVDLKRQADALAGPEHIAEARLQKRIEAILIKAGVVLTEGFLVAEAELRGVTQDAMATDVLAKAGSIFADELARQQPDVANEGTPG